jgi:hypothetical protein
MDILFGTVVRTALIPQGGELVRLDWSTKKVKAAVPVYPSHPSLDDPNPRGNTRGCRGIQQFGTQIIAANYHTLQIYDQQLELQREISHPLFAGLHEIFCTPEGTIWVTSTAIDAALAIDPHSGTLIESFWPREMPSFQKALGLTPLLVDKQTDNRTLFLSNKHLKHPSHLHLNAVTLWQGEVYALFHAHAAVANLSRGTIILKDSSFHRGHNLLVLDDNTLVINDTFGRTIRFYDLSNGHLLQVIDVMTFPWVRELERKVNPGLLKTTLGKVGLGESVARPLFLRGLDRVGDLLFVGCSPAAILCINWRTKSWVDAYLYNEDVRTCVHGLQVWKDE